MVPMPASVNSSSSTTCGHAAVEDVGRADAVLDGVDARRDLRDHAAGERARRRRAAAARSAVDAADEAGGIVDVGEQALDVGEVDHLLGAERLGDGAGDGVGVDVVGLPGQVGADRRHDRDEVLGEEPLEDAGFTASTSPTKPRSGWRALARISPASSPDRPTASGPCTLMADDDVAVDLADEHHAGDVEAVGVGDAQPVAELGLHAEPLHQRADLRAAAVHDDGPDADRLQQHDVLGELPGRGAASVMAWPPYFTTTRAPRKRRMYGSASTRTSVLARRRPRPSRRAHVLVDVGVREVVGDGRSRAVADAEVGTSAMNSGRARDGGGVRAGGRHGPCDTTTSP